MFHEIGIFLAGANFAAACYAGIDKAWPRALMHVGVCLLILGAGK